jgi:hypothetical protein
MEIMEEEKVKFCEICYDDHPIEQFINIPECGHGYCEPALKEFFNFKIMQSG